MHLKSSNFEFNNTIYAIWHKHIYYHLVANACIQNIDIELLNIQIENIILLKNWDRQKKWFQNLTWSNLLSNKSDIRFWFRPDEVKKKKNPTEPQMSSTQIYKKI